MRRRDGKVGPETDVDVWWIELTSPPGGLSRLQATLSGAELGDVRRLRRAADATALAVSRVALRGSSPRTWASCRPHWRWSADASTAAVATAVLRSRRVRGALASRWPRTATHAVVAIGRCAVGVDVERVRPLDDVMGMASLFADAERAALAALPGTRRQRAFLSVWTRKEAYLKARGEGLRRDLRDFVVSPAEQPPSVLSSGAGDAGAWTLVELSTPEDQLVATLAAAATTVNVRTRSWKLPAE